MLSLLHCCLILDRPLILFLVIFTVLVYYGLIRLPGLLLYNSSLLQESILEEEVPITPSKCYELFWNVERPCSYFLFLAPNIVIMICP